MCSDGELSPDQLLECLKDAGYNVIAITDHMKITTPWKIPDDIIFIHGVEWYCHLGYEIVALLPSTDLEGGYLDLSQTRVKWIAHPIHGFGRRMFPTDLSVNVEALIKTILLNRLDGYELYNATDRQLTELEEAHIPELTDQKINQYAVDDFHVKGQEFKAWMEMDIADLDIDLVIKNLQDGNYVIRTEL